MEGRQSEQPQPLQPRKLYRGQTTRMVPGVCGGMAEYFNLDVSPIRVLFVVLTVLGGSRPSDLPGDVDPGPRPSKAKPSTGG
jgi:phage shock protein C